MKYHFVLFFRIRNVLNKPKKIPTLTLQNIKKAPPPYMGSEADCLFCLASLYLSCFANQIQSMPTCCGRPC